MPLCGSFLKLLVVFGVFVPLDGVLMGEMSHACDSPVNLDAEEYVKSRGGLAETELVGQRPCSSLESTCRSTN